MIINNVARITIIVLSMLILLEGLGSCRNNLLKTNPDFRFSSWCALQNNDCDRNKFEKQHELGYKYGTL